MTDQDKRLVEDYLTRVERATAGLPPTRRVELVNDLREHIQALYADEPGGGEAHVRSILDRLGDPEAIAAEAGAPPSVTTAPTAGAAPRTRSRLGVWILAVLSLLAVFLVCGSVFLLADTRSENEPAVPVPAVSEP